MTWLKKKLISKLTFFMGLSAFWFCNELFSDSLDNKLVNCLKLPVNLEINRKVNKTYYDIVDHGKQRGTQ